MTKTTIKNRLKTLMRVGLSMVALAISMVFVSVGAADAAATVTMNANGDIIINGDNSDETVTIQPGGNDDLYVLVDSSNGSAVYIFEDTYRDINLTMRGGNDVVVFIGGDDMSFRRGTINLGGGDNHVNLSSVDFTDNFRVIDGTGSSDVTLDAMNVDGTTNMIFGSGSDSLSVLNGDWKGSTLVSASNAGSISADIRDLRSYSGFEIRGGNNADQVSFRGNTDFFGTMTLNLNGGNDSFTTQSGSDFFGNTNLRMGSGHDRVNLFGNKFVKALTFQGEGGNDLFNTTASLYSGTVNLNGGTGTDQLSGEANTFYHSPTINGFEVS